jgi:hypothetical protein
VSHIWQQWRGVTIWKLVRDESEMGIAAPFNCGLIKLNNTDRKLSSLLARRAVEASLIKNAPKGKKIIHPLRGARARSLYTFIVWTSRKS